MRSEHMRVRLGECVDLATGFPFKSTGYSDAQCSVRLLRGDNVAQGVLRWEDAKRWPQEAYDGLLAYSLCEDDVVLAMDRPWIAAGLKFAHIRRADLPCLLVQRVARLRAKTGLDSRFLRYVIGGRQFTDYILSVQTGTAVPHISAGQIAAFEFFLPPLHEQQVVGELLGVLDDRIDLLRQTNATFESIAEALYKSWFIDFDPVRAKAQDREPEGMDPATAALFPSAFEDSALGLIPKGWRVGTVRDVCSIFDSKRIPLSGKERAERQGPYPYYGAAALMDHVDSFIFDGVYLLLGEDGSVTNADGTPITQYVWGKFWVNNHAHVLRGANGVSTEHLMLALRGMDFTPYVTGAVQAKLNQANLFRIPFLQADPRVAEAFGSEVETLYGKLRANSDQAATLASLRDSLLPRLISGKLRIPEAYAQLEEAIA